MSNTFSKPITSSTLNFQMSVIKVVSNDMDYETFCERFMAQRTLPPMNETDEEYEKRCDEAWTKLVDAQKRKGYHEFADLYDDDGDDEDHQQGLYEEMEDYINDLIATDEDDEYAKLENAERRKATEERQSRIEATALQMRLLKQKHDEEMLKLQQQMDKLWE